MSSEEVKDELKQLCQSIELNNKLNSSEKISIESAQWQFAATGRSALYAMDALVRRSDALQRTKDAAQECVRINSRQAEQSGVMGAEKVRVNAGGCSRLSSTGDR